MHAFASAVILIYAALLVAGGYVGWRKSGSRISLTAGLISAALLSVAFRVVWYSPRAGYLMADIVAIALSIMFSLRFRKTKKFMPAGMMLVVSDVVAVILAWSTISSWSGK